MKGPMETLPVDSPANSFAGVNQTLSNARWLLLQRGLHILTGIGIAVAVPRMMGPQLYGRYALLTSLALWFALFSGLGSTQMMGRFVAGFVREQNQEGLRKLFGNLLTLRFLNGLGAAALYFFLAAYWLREYALSALFLIAISVCLRTVCNLIFALFLGMNQAAKWGMGELLRGLVSLPLLIAGFKFGGLTGACLALPLTELVILGIGSCWARGFFSRQNFGVDRNFLAPFLRFGLTFFASNMLLALTQRGGELLLRASCGDYAQVGFFGAAFRIFQMGQFSIWQLSISFLPFFTQLYLSEDKASLCLWIERLQKWISLAGVSASFLVLLLGENLIPLVFGNAFRPVVKSLFILMLAFILLSLANTARLLALVEKKPGESMLAASIQLGLFCLAGVPLARRGGSAGAALAVLLSISAYAIYLTWQMRGKVGYNLKSWAQTILLAVPFLPLAVFRDTLPENVCLLMIFLIGYSWLIWRFRVVTGDELRQLRQAFRQREVSLPSVE